MSEYQEIKTTEFTPKESGLVEVRTTVRVFKDGAAFGAPSHHRVVVNPHTDLDNVPLTPHENGPLPEDAQAAIRAWWTPERVARYDAAVQVVKQTEGI